MTILVYAIFLNNLKMEKEIVHLEKHLNEINKSDYNITLDLMLYENENHAFVMVSFTNNERVFRTDDYFNFNYKEDLDFRLLNKLNHIKMELEDVLEKDTVEEFIEEIKDIIY